MTHNLQYFCGSHFFLCTLNRIVFLKHSHNVFHLQISHGKLKGNHIPFSISFYSNITQDILSLANTYTLIEIVNLFLNAFLITVIITLFT